MKQKTRIVADSKQGTIKLDRTNSGVRFSAPSEREFPVDILNDEISLCFIMDVTKYDFKEGLFV